VARHLSDDDCVYSRRVGTRAIFRSKSAVTYLQHYVKARLAGGSVFTEHCSQAK
jgi:hypothetical protein